MDNENPLLYKKSNRAVLLSKDSDELLNGSRCSSLTFANDCTITNCLQNSNHGTIRSLFIPNNDTDPFNSEEIFDIVRNIKDPEYSHTLEELKVVDIDNIYIDHEIPSITVYFSPTVTHCTQATLIGLMIFVKLHQSLPPKFKIDVQILKGTHDSEITINKQLLDKERIAAALENPLLIDRINDGIQSGTYENNLITPLW